MGKITFKDITTLKTGGAIKHYIEANNKAELVSAVDFAKNNNLKIFVIGSGSDVLAGDNNFNGVVMKYTANNITLLNDIVTAEAGTVWDVLVSETIEANLQGIESMSGIPGTVGASPIQNIGAYGQELADTFMELTAYDIENNKFVEFNKNDCKFGYRSSVFKEKTHWQKYIITDVTFKLKLNKDLDLIKIREETLKLRKEKLEDPNKIPNAGSFFMNPFVDLKMKTSLEEKFKDIKFYEQNGMYKISAGYLIEKAGWKGKALGNVKVSDKHALILTNPEGNGNFNDIKTLADKIILDVEKMFGIKLQPEVQYVNI